MKWETCSSKSHRTYTDGPFYTRYKQFKNMSEPSQTADVKRQVQSQKVNSPTPSDSEKKQLDESENGGKVRIFCLSQHFFGTRRTQGRLKDRKTGGRFKEKEGRQKDRR